MTTGRRHSLLYTVYMRSTLWHLRRWWWWLRSPRRCEDCGTPLVLHRRDLWGHLPPCEVLTVHHLHYRTLYRERRSDVALLCWRCHCRREPFRARSFRV